MEGFDHILNWKLKAGSHQFPGPDGGTCINEAALIAKVDPLGGTTGTAFLIGVGSAPTLWLRYA